MIGAVQIVKLLGIPVRIHWTFGLVFVLILSISFDYSVGFDWNLIQTNTLFVAVLFACVLLHEYGHALTAKRFGIDTTDIILSPIGGVARLNRLPDKPIQELWVALAGPLVNLAIIAALIGIIAFWPPEKRGAVLNLLPYLGFQGGNSFYFHLDAVDRFVIQIVQINFVLAVFNLIPAFPLDGGRILRALLSLRMGKLEATRWATRIGQLFGVFLVIYGVWQFAFIIAFLGVFIFFLAASEFKYIKWETLLGEYQVRDLLRSHYLSFVSSDTTGKIAETLKTGLERDFIVFDNSGKLLGVVTEDSVLKSVNSDRGDQKVAAITTPLEEVLHPGESLKSAFFKIQRHNTTLLPVVEDGDLIGVIDLATIEKFTDKF